MSRKLHEPVAVVPVKRLQELEARAAEATVPNARADALRIGRQVRYSPALGPWMLAYAEWLTLTCALPPSRTERRITARRLSRIGLTDAHLRILEAREDFKAYCVELQRGPLEAARQKYLRLLPDYVDAHYEALGHARLAGDYKVAAQIAETALDRVLPKKAESVQATQVNIVLTAAQVEGVRTYSAPPILVQEPTDDRSDADADSGPGSDA